MQRVLNGIRRNCLWSSVLWLWLGLLLLASGSSILQGGEVEDCRALLWAGDYDAAIAKAKEKVDAKTWNEGWSRILIEGYLITGKYEEAATVFEGIKDRYYSSLTLRLLAIEAYRYSNQQAKALVELENLPVMIQRSPWQYTTREQLVPLGKYFLMAGEDARKVLEQCYDRVLKQDPKLVEAYIASAELALQKEDATVALQALQKAEQLEPRDPHVFYLTALAWSNSDSQRASEALKRALQLNSKHVQSLLLAVENRIDAEDYSSALKLLDEVEKINPRQPSMWALRAVIYHLRGEFEEEESARKQALATWSLNPEVDHLIGRKLSQNYRFRESVAHQRFALEMDPAYTPARSQLAQDLLRLGETDEGWKLVNEVRKADSYNITVFNLKQLEETLKKFTTLEAPGFVVRMESKEAALYGEQVLKLLADARITLVTKYQAKLEEPIYVEIFPRQADFAIRTFGMPGGEGFLGVCFGRLITANSPAALGASPSNWQSVLWHEYCHVVTLQKSRNRMPRWLSEGISVYEETLKKKAWGMPMDATYRLMILGGEVPNATNTAERNESEPSLFAPQVPEKKNQPSLLKPLSQMSAAFQDAKSPLEVQFAYFQSSLAVEFLVERFGITALQGILDSLAQGLSAQDSLQRHAGTIEQLDKAFVEFARRRALQWGEQADFESRELPAANDEESWSLFLKEHPNHIAALEGRIEHLIKQQQWSSALELLERLQSLIPEDASISGVYALKARIHQAQGDVSQERMALVQLVNRNADATDALERLLDIDKQAERWSDVLLWSEELLSVKPFIDSTYRSRAEAAQRMSQPLISASCWRAILQLDPIDPAEANLRYAEALATLGDFALAKRHALMAIEEAPRYREALMLYRQLMEKESLPDYTLPPEHEGQPPMPSSDSDGSPAQDGN